MHRPLVISVLASLTLLAACKPAPPETAATTTDAGRTAATNASAPPHFGPDAVWSGNLEGCRQQQALPPEQCLLATMEQEKANPAAIALARHLQQSGTPAFLQAWREQQGVGIATLEYPFRANTIHGTWLVDRQGRAIDVDEDVLSDSDQQLPEVAGFLQAHPQSSPFASAEADGERSRDDGGVTLVFNSPLRDCHACATEGLLQLGYDFDAQRRYLGKRVLGIVPPPADGGLHTAL